MTSNRSGVKVGVLALQGAFAAHAGVLSALGAEPIPVRTPAQLDGVEALILPGGESTTISMLLSSSGLFDAIDRRLAGSEGSPLPVLGTCAGMILLASEVLDGRPDQRCFGALDVAVRRNAFGRQVDSFECDLAVAGVSGFEEGPLRAVFIRAPFVERTGTGVEVLARQDGHPVLVRSTTAPVWAAAFHPELSDDQRLHRRFLEEV